MTRPAYGPPRYYERDRSEPFADQEPAGARWDLAFGCALGFGPAENGGPLQVTIHMSDHEAAAAMCVRKVTPEQVREFARYLLRVVAEESGPIRCRTDGMSPHDPAVVLVNGDPRCEYCNTQIDARFERTPLPTGETS